MTTDGAAAMQSLQKGVIKRMQELSPNCLKIHCIFHRAALVARKLEAGGEQNELKQCQILFVNFIEIV